MDISLSVTEARVLGVLIEKERTTPDYYPLSLSAVTTASNQKSNREPMMSLSETQTLEALDGLIAKRLAWEKTPSGSRVTKYAHRLANTLGLTYDFSRDELGVLCVLMLRGAQTVGEIRARIGRLCEFASIAEAEGVLERLARAKTAPMWSSWHGKRAARTRDTCICCAVRWRSRRSLSPGLPRPRTLAPMSASRRSSKPLTRCAQSSMS